MQTKHGKVFWVYIKSLTIMFHNWSALHWGVILSRKKVNITLALFSTILKKKKVQHILTQNLVRRGGMLHAWQEKGSGMPLWLASF
jgi:hypothetical protein